MDEAKEKIIKEDFLRFLRHEAMREGVFQEDVLNIVKKNV